MAPIKVILDTATEELLAAAIDRFGPRHQLAQCQEECAELISAINRNRRQMCTEQEVCKEIADAQISLAMVAILFGSEQVETAIEQQLQKLAVYVGREHT